jgi:hypothetical protein
MHWTKSLSRHWALLVIVNDLDVEGVRSDPAKADPPLIVDADTVLTETICGELLQTVRRRNSEVREACSGVQHDELPKCDAKEIRRELANLLSTEQPFGLGVAEAADHQV